MHDYYLKWYQLAGNKEKVRVANQKYQKNRIQFSAFTKPELTECTHTPIDIISFDQPELLQLETFDHSPPKQQLDNMDAPTSMCHQQLCDQTSFWEILSMNPEF